MYVLAHRGPYSDPDWTPYPIADWNRAVPQGTRMVAFLETPPRDVDDAFDGRWARTRPLTAVRNGLVLESCGRVLTMIDGANGPAWTFDTLDELEAALDPN